MPSSRSLRRTIFLACFTRKRKRAMAHDGWLVGHARWFRSPAGKRLVERNRAVGRAARRRPHEAGQAMTWPAIANYLAAHWLEIAGTVTTVLGIWLTTRRLLICWPVVLAADFLYLVVFYRARLFSDALLQIFFVAFTLYGWWHWWRGVAEEGEVRVVPLRSARLARRAGRRRRWERCLLGWLMVAHWRSVASPGCRAYQLQPCRQLVAGAQTHRQLVALDCRRPRLHWRVSLQGSEDDGLLYAGLVVLAVLGPARLATRAGCTA